MKNQKLFRALVPLYYFPYQEASIPKHKILKIRKFKNPPNLKGLETELSKAELEELRSTPYWLTIVYNKSKVWDDSNITIIFLVALWLEVPTKTQAMHLFELSTDENSKEKTFTRCLDRFQWNKKHVIRNITSDNIKNAFRNFDLLVPIWKRKKRLSDALIMTVAGCMSFRWQIAYISFASAVETLLTYQEGAGITKRLAKSYACLMETNIKKRNAEYKKFRKLYKIRSDIIHGRMRRIAKTTKHKADKLLTILADFSSLLRNLWGKIVVNKFIPYELEKGDNLRSLFFDKIEMGSLLSKITEKSIVTP